MEPRNHPQAGAPHEWAGKSHGLKVAETNAEQFVDLVSILLTPFELITRRENDFRAKVNWSQLNLLGFRKVAFKSPASIRCENLNERYLIHVPLRGSLGAGRSARPEIYRPGYAHMYDGGGPLWLEIEEDCDVLAIRFEEKMVEEYLLKTFQDERKCPMRFNSHLSFCTEQGAGFWNFLNYIWGEVERSSPIFSSQLVSTELQYSFLSMLMTLCGEALDDEGTSFEVVRPAALRRAEEFIAASLADPLTMADIASAANIPARSLQRAFQHYRGMSPMAYIRRRRLEKVREELLVQDPSTASVSRVALQWGFAHLGRFSSSYKKLFNEHPSETLRR